MIGRTTGEWGTMFFRLSTGSTGYGSAAGNLVGVLWYGLKLWVWEDHWVCCDTGFFGAKDILL